MCVLCVWQQIRLHGDLIIATIWAFLQARGMLHRLPAMVKGGFLHAPPVQVADCPSWRTPQSDEALEVSTSSSILSLHAHHFLMMTT